MGILQEFREFQNGGRNSKAKGYMRTTHNSVTPRIIELVKLAATLSNGINPTCKKWVFGTRLGRVGWGAVSENKGSGTEEMRTLEV